MGQDERIFEKLGLGEKKMEMGVKWVAGSEWWWRKGAAVVVQW
jgi:hypothetical protein